MYICNVTDSQQATNLLYDKFNACKLYLINLILITFILHGTLRTLHDASSLGCSHCDVISSASGAVSVFFRDEQFTIVI